MGKTRAGRRRARSVAGRKSRTLFGVEGCKCQPGPIIKAADGKSYHLQAPIEVGGFSTLGESGWWESRRCTGCGATDRKWVEATDG